MFVAARGAASMPSADVLQDARVLGLQDLGLKV